MKKLLLILFTLLCLADTALAYQVVVIKSGVSQPYEDVALAVEREFRKGVPQRGLKGIEQHHFTNILVDDRMQGKKLTNHLTMLKADLVVTVGRKALAACNAVKKIPIIYTLVVNPVGLIQGRSNITGITLDVRPALFFAEVERLLPGAKSVGVVYDPARSGALVEQARRDLPHLHFVLRQATDARDVGRLLEDVGQVDLLWMVPDPVVASKAGMKRLFLHSFKNKIPVVTFSPKYLKPGAAIAVSPDLDAMGVKAADYAAKILSGTPVSAMSPTGAERAATTVNRTIAEKLNLPLNGDRP